ncbi:MAG: hypothetical protein ACQCXQ_09765 [Verrucomicrobiales bacterium]|nr:hypothetical protein [Verrucomicrobiota bacterium JB025]
MKYSTILTCVSLLTLAAGQAQNVQLAPEEDPVQKAIREFNSRDTSKPNEVVVVISRPELESPAPADHARPNVEPAVGNRTEPTTASETTSATDDATSADSAEPTLVKIKSPSLPDTPKQKKGLAVRVEKLHDNGQDFDASSVKLRAPFPAKPLAQPPAGWRIETSANTPPFTREIELEPGKSITLSVRPHLLVPEADGIRSFAIGEPGFEPSLGYQQATTVSAIISRSVRQLEDDSRDLGVAIDTLQQILVALPQPESVPQTKN